MAGKLLLLILISRKASFKKFELNHIFNYSINDNELLSNAIKSENWNVIICLAAWGGDGNGLLKAAKPRS